MNNVIIHTDRWVRAEMPASVASAVDALDPASLAALQHNADEYLALHAIACGQGYSDADAERVVDAFLSYLASEIGIVTQFTRCLLDKDVW